METEPGLASEHPGGISAAVIVAAARSHAAMVRKEGNQPDPEGSAGLLSIVHSAALQERQSLEMAGRLLNASLWSPSLVWSVRSVEIFMRFMVLLPHHYSASGYDMRKAQRAARRHFGSAGWRRALAILEGEYGPIDPMLTTEDEDVWDVWLRDVIGRRGDIVHGRDEASPAEAAQVLEWAGLMGQQLRTRLVVAGRHPISHLFMATLAEARRLEWGKDETP